MINVLQELDISGLSLKDNGNRKTLSMKKRIYIKGEYIGMLACLRLGCWIIPGMVGIDLIQRGSQLKLHNILNRMKNITNVSVLLTLNLSQNSYRYLIQ